MSNFFVAKYKSPLAIFIALITAAGVYAYFNLQTELFPEITFPKIKVIADAGLQPVDKMMVTVTKPLELAIKQVPGLTDLRTSTSRGSTEFNCFFSWNTDIDLAKQQVEAAIANVQANLPPDIEFSVGKMNPAVLPVMGYALTSNRLSPMDQRWLADNTIKPFLSQVQGISQVIVLGGKQMEYRVDLDLQKLSTLQISPEEVRTAISKTNFLNANGYTNDYRRLYLSVTDEGLHNLSSIQNIVVKNESGTAVLLKDIASVQVHQQQDYTRVNANGNDAVLVAIVRQQNANVTELSNSVEEKVKELQKILPADTHFTPYYIQADFVNETINSVRDSLLIGLVLALFVSLLFLRSLRATASVLFTIPVTLCLTLLVLYVSGYTFNIMTFGAMAAAIGLIIDDAIVVVEQIHRMHEENPRAGSSINVQSALRFLFPAMVGSSLSTIVIFIPFIIMSGVAGAYFKVMTNTMIITLLCSFLVSWIALPVFYLLFGREKFSAVNIRHERRSQPWISFFVRNPWISGLFICGLIICIVFILPELETGFLPEMDEGSLVFDYWSPPGTSLDETDRMLREVEKIILSEPDVQSYSRRTGLEMGFFVTEPNKGDYLIQLKKNRTRTSKEVIADLREKVSSTQPALRIDFGQVIGDMLGDLMESVQPIEVKVFGNNDQKLQMLSDKIDSIVSAVPGTADVFNGIVITGPSQNIIPDNAHLAQFNEIPDDFQFQLQNETGGTEVGHVITHEQQVPIRMFEGDTLRDGANQLQKQQFMLPNYMLSEVSDFSTMQLTTGIPEIQRENLQSMGVITARLDNRDLGSVMKDIQQNIQSQISLPEGFHIEYGGAYAEQQQSFDQLLLILISACLLVFLVMLFLFRKIKVAVLIFFIASLGISGSLIALYITATPLNVGSYTGLIMIVGIIGENAIFTCQQFFFTLKTKSVDDAIVYAISTRLRPKVMTALSAIIALMPLALGIGAGAQLHQPLAISVIGGFVIALPLLLIVLPSGLKILFRREKNISLPVPSS